MFLLVLSHLGDQKTNVRLIISCARQDKPSFNYQLHTLLRKMRRVYLRCKERQSRAAWLELRCLQDSFQGSAGKAKLTYFVNLGKKLVGAPNNSGNSLSLTVKIIIRFHP